MARIYLDHAASTPLLPEVYDAMQPYFQLTGNPNAIHNHGRHLRVAIETARKSIAACVNASPAEIFFTSGATEANNWALIGALSKLNIQEVISSPLEHASVLETLSYVSRNHQVKLTFISHQSDGTLDATCLSKHIRQAKRPVLVSLMHVNNEIGNVLDIAALRSLLAEEQIYVHSDMVQSIGHLPVAFSSLPIHFASASAHKFHGPQGIGFLYIKKGTSIAPLLYGGKQERYMRAGTENTAGIVGMATALQVLVENMHAYTTHIQMLKKYMVRELHKAFPEGKQNGAAHAQIHTILSASLPLKVEQESLLMRLDIEGISASIGSACSSGSVLPSHVLSKTQAGEPTPSLRFSFSHLNTMKEIHQTVHTLKHLQSE